MAENFKFWSSYLTMISTCLMVFAVIKSAVKVLVT